ncbi:hypothetical protein B9Z19DRAFT_1086001 [Tuber borchii]|uniref:Uncharacterized protein n=1 Tax=Tuber borchii TaxID=42251 RepID=A0A2T6ZQ46_TUBBO|nr:hypothetical protein B9Z19DRAFT_1086001 [Tuber borchii]
MSTIPVQVLGQSTAPQHAPSQCRLYCLRCIRSQVASTPTPEAHIPTFLRDINSATFPTCL